MRVRSSGIVVDVVPITMGMLQLATKIATQLDASVGPLRDGGGLTSATPFSVPHSQLIAARPLPSTGPLAAGRREPDLAPLLHNSSVSFLLERDIFWHALSELEGSLASTPTSHKSLRL